MTIAEAFKHLKLHGNITMYEEVANAFRREVKAASTGDGNYTADMDDLVCAKETVNLALKKEKQEEARKNGPQNHADTMRQTEQQAQAEEMRQRAEQAQADAIRRRAHEEELKEDRQRYKREQRQREAKEAKEVKEAQERMKKLQSLQAWEHEQARKREQARKLWSYHISDQQARQRGRKQRMQREAGDELQQSLINDDLDAALSLLQQRRMELEQICQREQTLIQELRSTQMHRSRLEEAVQNANILAKQIHAILG